MDFHYAFPIGFIGLGSMGEAMAANLVKAGAALVVWNRTSAKCRPLADAGATIAKNATDVFARCNVAILMLFDGPAIDEVLMRGDAAFGENVGGHTIINMATTSPAYSKGLEADIRAAGGCYVEAPVSGSRKPAEAGQLVAMLAGEREVVEGVRSLLASMCHRVEYCGPVPKALLMKLSVNHFNFALTVGLVEAVHLARKHGVDISQLTRVLDAGSMASDYLDLCDALFAETSELGFDNADLIAVVHSLEQRPAVPV
jgi:3-hydroxyisobutyrate dehydrogenase